MRLIFLFFLQAIIMAACLSAAAQATCDGSLGDAVINQDFGSGPNPGPQLAPGFTNMFYTPNNCPDDGYYTIANSLTGNGNCHPDTWHSVTTDHTGNPNGYMMIVNANNLPSVFFTDTAKNLCPNTVYQFKAYILNLITLAASGPDVHEPDITFTVERLDGTPIVQPFNTGTIQPTANPTWVPDSIFFKTPADVSEVVVKLTNNAPGGNGNDLILDDITFRACGPVILASFNAGDASANSSICQGTDTTFKLTATIQPGVYAQPAYQWQTSTNGITWVDSVGQTAATLARKFVNAAPGTYQYRLGVADGANISSPNCRVYSSPLTITVNPNPVINNVGPTDFQCEGDELELYATGGTDYEWTGPNLPVTHQNPVYIKNLTAANAGTYKVTVFSQYSCITSASTQLTIFPKPKAIVTSTTTICKGAVTTLNASGGISYTWSPGNSLSDSTIANPVASPTDTTTYKVIVTNTFGCHDTAFVTVNVLKKPVANAGPDKVIFEGQSVKLTASAKYSDVFYWTPTTGLSDPDILNPIASPTNDITYTLHATSAQNCGTDTSSVFVRVYKKITIPNSFSPNNDGINDLWNIDALITYPQSIMTVFNRYGQQVYRDVGYSKPWNGTYNGQPLPSGTYYYILDLKNNTPKISGWVVVVR